MVNKIILNLRNAGRDTDIEFPCTEKEMSEALEKIAIPDLNAPKVYVSEVVEPSGLSMLEGKTLNLDEVNYLAKLLDSLVQDERDKIYSVANYEEAYKILKERSKKREERNSIAFTTKGKALLSGNIYCAHCGARLYTTTYSNPVTLSDGTVKRYTGLKYMCTNKARGRGRCEGQGQYIVERIDAIVLETVNDLLNKIHDNIKDVTIKRNYERVLKEKRDLYAALMKEYTKEQDKLKKLVEEVGKALINESAFSVDIINQSINQSKTRMAELEEKIPKALKELNDQDGMLKNLDQYYDQFIGWADSFASASLEEKKVIICRLISRIEIGRDYNVNIVLNVNYSQFVE